MGGLALLLARIVNRQCSDLGHSQMFVYILSLSMSAGAVKDRWQLTVITR